MTYTCPKCGHTFEGGSDWVRLHCHKCGTSWNITASTGEDLTGPLLFGALLLGFAPIVGTGLLLYVGYRMIKH